MSTMTYDQAVEQSIKMKNEGATYPKIEAYLKKNGYTSSRTKRPVSALAVRHMVTRAKEKAEFKDPKTPENEAVYLLGDATKEVNNAVRVLLDSDKISQNIKSKLIVYLINNSQELLKQ